MIKLPEKYKIRMKSLLGDDFEKYEASLSEPPVKAFRVNTEKISLENFEKINIFGNEKIPYCESGYYLNFEKAGNHPFHHAGMLYIQEPGAMMPAECIDLNPDWTVLDMCAAPGGKSSQLKNKLSSKGLLVSNEIIPSRCKILTGNFERMGFENAVTTCMDTGRLAELFPSCFDLIMVDAPCSGEGMFRKEEAALSEWSEENVKKCSLRQKKILENAVTCLKEKGIIIYATCTFSLEENEMVIDDFLSKHRDFSLMKAKESVEASTCNGILFEGCKNESLVMARRFYPHTCRGEGQFAAILKRDGETAAKPRKRKDKSKEKEEAVPKLVTDFLSSVLTHYDKDALRMYNGKPVFYKGNLEIKKGSAFSCGVTVGEIKKSYIEPHHQFFMAMGKHFKRKINLPAESEKLCAYLRGEELEVECENGWAVITTEGCTVGGVKVVNGKAKNHYPKGLRLK